MANVDNSYLVNVSISLNTTVVQPASFNNSMIAGVFAASPSSWGSTIFKLYTSSADVLADFGPLITGTTLQDTRYQWLINAVSEFFAQTPTPANVILTKIVPPAYGVAFNYVTALTAIAAANNNFIPFTIADKLALTNSATGTPSHLQVQIDVTVTGDHTIPANWAVVLTAGASPVYKTTGTTDIPSSGPYTLDLYSNDVTTKVPAANITGHDAVSGITFNTVQNAAPATLGAAQVAGFAGTTGLSAASAALRGAKNAKICLMDTKETNVDPSATIAAQLQIAGGDDNLMICNNQNNFLPVAGSSDAVGSTAAACLQRYFGNIFSSTVGLKQFGSMQLNGKTPIDANITTENIGFVEQGTGFVGYNNNVYAGFGGGVGIGLMQYGTMTSSKPSKLVFIDQIVIALYLQIQATSKLVTYLLDQVELGGVPYDDSGIQALLAVFRAAMQLGVDQKGLQPLANNMFTYLTFAQVKASFPEDIAAKTYPFLGFNGELLSRIQRVSVAINLTL